MSQRLDSQVKLSPFQNVIRDRSCESRCNSKFASKQHRRHDAECHNHRGADDLYLCMKKRHARIDIRRRRETGRRTLNRLVDTHAKQCIREEAAARVNCRGSEQFLQASPRSIFGFPRNAEPVPIVQRAEVLAHQHCRTLGNELLGTIEQPAPAREERPTTNFGNDRLNHASRIRRCRRQLRDEQVNEMIHTIRSSFAIPNAGARFTCTSFSLCTFFAVSGST